MMFKSELRCQHAAYDAYAELLSMLWQVIAG
jgi:hypothetical protein